MHDGPFAPSTRVDQYYQPQPGQHIQQTTQGITIDKKSIKKKKETNPNGGPTTPHDTNMQIIPNRNSNGATTPAAVDVSKLSGILSVTTV